MSKVFEQKDDEYYYFEALQIIKQKPNELDKLEDFDNILKSVEKIDGSFVYDEFNSLLHEACYYGNLSIVNLLLDENFEINRDCDVEFFEEDKWKPFNEVTPLHLACYKGHQDIVEKLIASGAEIDSWGSWGKRSLHFAVESQQPAIVKLLLSQNANTNLEDCNAKTPLDLAKDNSDIEKLIKNSSGYSESSRIGFFDTPLDTENNNDNEAPSLSG